MSEYRWRRADESDVLLHCPDHSRKNIFYARVYTSRQGFAYSDTNQLILNLKIEPSQRHRLNYKNDAIGRFSSEVAEFLNRSQDTTRTKIIVPMPPSKAQGDPEYDDRVQQAAARIQQTCPNYRVVPLLHAPRSMAASHSSDTERSADEIHRWLAIDETACSGLPSNPIVVILDDIITSGSHYEGARRRVLDRFPDALVVGVFWAKSRNPDAASDFTPV